MWRVAKEDCEIGGVIIPKGSTILLKYFSSNHDEEIFEEPMRFDVTRENARSHIAFGFGIHVCIGQLLSKQEMVNGWQVMFQKLKNFPSKRKTFQSFDSFLKNVKVFNICLENVKIQ